MTLSLTTSSVAVVGSANLDMVVHAKHTPRPGETVLGDRLTEHAGGKGLNQSIASAAHAPTALIGAVGTDRVGGVLRDALEKASVDVRRLRTFDGDSGIAVVSLASDAENSIIVISGANDEVTADDAVSSLDALRPEVVVTQLETPLDSVVAAARWAKENGARWVFNPSPVNRLFDLRDDDEIHELIAGADPIIVNADEGRSVLAAEHELSPEEVARELAGRVASVVVTDGARGAWVGDRSRLSLVAAAPVRAVDTTGAGDTFAGTMAALIALGSTLEDAASAASAAAARVVATERSKR